MTSPLRSAGSYNLEVPQIGVIAFLRRLSRLMPTAKPVRLAPWEEAAFTDEERHRAERRAKARGWNPPPWWDHL